MKYVLLIPLLLLLGCQHLAPGADPFLVRFEQAQTIGFTTLDTFLKIEAGAQAFIKTNAPAVHAFAEQLRERTPSGDRRWVGYLRSADQVKLAYKHGLASSNELVTALAVLETATTETQKQLSILHH